MPSAKLKQARLIVAGPTRSNRAPGGAFLLSRLWRAANRLGRRAARSIWAKSKGKRAHLLLSFLRKYPRGGLCRLLRRSEEPAKRGADSPPARPAQRAIRATILASLRGQFAGPVCGGGQRGRFSGAACGGGLAANGPAEDPASGAVSLAAERACWRSGGQSGSQVHDKGRRILRFALRSTIASIRLSPVVIFAARAPFGAKACAVGGVDAGAGEGEGASGRCMPRRATFCHPDGWRRALWLLHRLRRPMLSPVGFHRIPVIAIPLLFLPKTRNFLLSLGEVPRYSPPVASCTLGGWRTYIGEHLWHARSLI